MNKAFEKILEFIDEQIKIEESIAKSKNEGRPITHQYGANCMNVIKKFVHEVAEEYKGGWIACSEMLPEPNQKVIVSYMDRYIGGSYGVCEGQYVYILNSWDISDYMSDDDFEVIAWQPLPEPFKERD